MRTTGEWLLKMDERGSLFIVDGLGREIAKMDPIGRLSNEENLANAQQIVNSTREKDGE